MTDDLPTTVVLKGRALKDAHKRLAARKAAVEKRNQERADARQAKIDELTEAQETKTAPKAKKKAARKRSTKK